LRRFHPAYLTCALVLALCCTHSVIAGQQAPGSPQIADGLNSLQGAKVASVEVTGPAVEHPEWLQPLLLQKPDQPLDKYKVRQTVQALFNTGRFTNIEVEASRNPNGEVALIFATRESYFFGSILVEGSPSRPSDAQLVSAGRLTLGEQFTEDKIKAAMEGMQRVLTDAGFYRAAIEPVYDWNATEQQVKVLFKVTRGLAARVGRITATGTSSYTATDVSRIAKLRPGQKVTDGLARRATDRLRKKLLKKRLLEAQVTLTARTYHPESNTLDYTFEIIPGPVVDVKVEGANLNRNTVKRLVPVFEENTIDEDLLNEGARNIQNFLQTQGYFEARVTFDQRRSDNNRQDVVYTVQRNSRHKLASIVIEGNKYFLTADIRERMQMQTAGILSRHGLFSQALLSRDVSSIEDLYRSNGFRAVRVTSHVNDNYGGKVGRLQVVISISEGQQTKVGEVSIEGNSVLSTDAIRSLISAQTGQPYSDATVVNDQTAVLNTYFDLGFPNARFSYSTKPDHEDPNKVDISYQIEEGSQVFVNRVLISGLHFTRPSVVNREMKVRSGRPLSQRAMLDTQGNLYNLGLFNEVDMAVQNPEGDFNHKSVNFQLTEAKRYTFNYGFGLEIQTGQAAGPTNPQGATGVSPRVSFGVTRINFRGRDQTVSLKTRYGNLEKLALIGFTEPRVFDNPRLTLDFTAFYQQTKDVSTFTATREEGSAQLRQRLNRSTTLLYRMIYRRVETSNLVINPAEVPIFSQPVRIGMPAFTYIRNTRDNDLDSHKGSFSLSDIGVAANAFGSQTNFVRWIGQNSTYYQFGRKRWVLARNTRIGIEEPFGDTSAAVVSPGPGAPSPSSFIPLPERFFAGGATSLRGFGVNQAGPRDLSTGLPLGGEALFINNVELRTPPVALPFSFIGNNMSLVVFNDVGNAFTTPNAMFTSLYKFTQPNRQTCLNFLVPNCNFNYMSFAAGSGIRYKTPIGPVSFDVGYNFNPPAFPVASPIQPSQVPVTCTPGAIPVSSSCPNQPFSSVLRHFNFFFNIGQTF
jgi:outer membrane protein assembly complex protein YaeT